MTQTFDAIVLGLGAMGAAATYQLAKRGVRVLGIDQFDPPHRLGSSHGETRITRIACGEGPQYTAFARRSHEIWREIEAELPTLEGKLLTQNGILVIAGPRSPGAHGNPHFLRDTKRIADDAGIAAETLTASAVRARFPAFAIADDEEAYFDRVSGFLRPEACIGAQLTLARKHGATLHANETVQRFEPNAGSVRVTTNKGTYEAARLIVTAGSWLPNFLPPARAAQFAVRRQVQYWFAPRSENDLAQFKPDRFPVFIWLVPTQGIYGFPALGGCDDGVKIATEQDHLSITPEAVDRTVSARETEEMYETYIRPFFPGLTNRCVRAEVCLYTSTKDSRFIIDRHPTMENVIVASPCSGHGFKHSAAIGEVLAQMTVGETQADIRHFAFDRPRA